MQIPGLWFADSSKSLGLRRSGPPSPPEQTSVKKGYKLTGELNAQSKSVVVKKNKEIFSSVNVFSSTYGYDYTTICAELKSRLSPAKIIEKRDD
jgi:hypothetical protein